MDKRLKICNFAESFSILHTFDFMKPVIYVTRD